MTNKIEKYIELKVQLNQLKEVVEALGEEIKADVKWNIKHKWYVLSKKSKQTFALKDTVSIDDIEKEYPEIIEKKVNAKELYKIALLPESLVDIKETIYLNVWVDKNTGSGLEF